MTYEELLEALDAAEWEGKTDFRDSLTGVYDGITAGANAKIAELEEQVDTLKNDLVETQAQNYQLLMAQTDKVEEANERKVEDKEPSEEDKSVDKLIKD